MAEKKKHAGHGYKRGHAQHHKDGSITAHLEHEDGAQHDVKRGLPSLDHLHDMLEESMGQPNTGEGVMPQPAMPGAGA